MAGEEVTLTVLRGEETLELPVVLGARPAQAAASGSSQPDDEGISAREAIAIAEDAVKESGLLSRSIEEKVATPDEQDGIAVWVVELSTSRETAMVVVDAVTGEVLALNVR